jgi:hypothetical protein
MDAPRRWRLVIPVFTIWLACIAVPAHSQALWKDSQVGMSLQATQKQFPKAIRPSAPTQLGDGSRELLRLQNAIVQDHAFDALFFFKQGKLTQVSLELQEQGGAVFALQTFRGIKAAFDAKYGAPDGEEDQQFDAPTGPATFRSASWRSKQTLITLSYATAAGRLVVLNVAYRLATDRKTDDI